MKKRNRRIITALLAVIMMFAMTMSASALTERSFGMTITTPYAGSLKYTTAYARTSGTAYLTTERQTPNTKYYLAPSGDVSTHATAEITTPSPITKRSFSWYSGYGGSGVYYRLAAYPASMSNNYSEYIVSGYWAI